MADERAEEIGYFLRERVPRSLDECSEGQSDHEEVEEHVSGPEEADEDSDFDPKTSTACVDDEDSNDFEEQTRRSAGRPQHIIKGKNGFKWSKNAPETRGRHSIKTYIPSGKGAAKNIRTPLEAWTLLFTDKILNVIVLYTNEEIDRKYPNSEVSFEHHLSVDELKAFIGLLYFSGIQKWNHVSLNEIWSEKFGNNLFRSAMSQRRFEFLLSNLRFDDKSTRAERRVQHKLAPIKEL